MKNHRKSSLPTSTLPPLDAGWLWLESETNLMHASVLTIFRRPAGAGPRFVADLVEDMRKHTTAESPYNLRLKRVGLARLWPQWEALQVIDTEYHIRHSALPWPADERELGKRISHLHSTPLNHSHPLWTIHVIEGLDDNRFAVFGKLHHALSDGVGGVALIQRWLSTDADQRGMPPIWTHTPRARTHVESSDTPTPHAGYSLRTVRGGIARSGRTAAGIATAIRFATKGVSAPPRSAPRSALNTPITDHRRISTQSYELDRFRKLAQQIDGTINDIVLAVCSGGLRKYLDEIDDLPSGSLITNIPVSVTSSTSQKSTGNAISWAMVSLATDFEDVRERVQAIKSATSQAKSRLGQMRGSALNAYTMMVTTPILLEQMLGAGGHTRPLFNVPISNVPGPRERLYLNGAEMENIHAMTVLYGGQALNIVCLSYADLLEFTFTACATSLPRIQRLSILCREALDELEKVLLGVTTTREIVGDDDLDHL